VKLLGEIPIDTNLRISGDAGKPIVIADPESESSKIFKAISKNLILEINKKNILPASEQKLEISI
jgi:ATP-binding protein involved in chromosome partitioning